MSEFYLGVTAGSLPPTVPTSFTTDSGKVIPSSNSVNINGGPGIEVIANPNGSNNILIQMDDVASSYTNVAFGMSPYTVTATDYYISVDCSAGPVTINLPDSPTANREFIIKDRLGQSLINNITVKSLTGAATIDQMINYVFTDAFESIECLFHGANYEIF